MPKSRSLPYIEVSAKKTDGSPCRYQMWEDLPIVRIVEGADQPLLVLKGEHWILKSIKLHAFTDHRDTVVEENEYSFFRKGLFEPLEGEIFFLEDPETEEAILMLSNPLFWLELQFLSEKRRQELAPLLSVWKEHRDVLASADVMPIGERPSGRSFTGFYAQGKGGEVYLLLFREVTGEDTGVFKLPVTRGTARVLASNGEVEVTVKDGFAAAKFSKPRSYAFIRIE